MFKFSCRVCGAWNNIFRSKYHKSADVADPRSRIYKVNSKAAMGELSYLIINMLYSLLQNYVSQLYSLRTLFVK